MSSQQSGCDKWVCGGFRWDEADARQASTVEGTPFRHDQADWEDCRRFPQCVCENCGDDFGTHSKRSVCADCHSNASSCPICVSADPNGDAAEAAYWRFDARRKGIGPWRGCPQSERDAFKAEWREACESEKC